LPPAWLYFLRSLPWHGRGSILVDRPVGSYAAGMKLLRVSLLAGLLLSGCSAGRAGPDAAIPSVPAWRNLATSADRKRLHDWREAWLAGLAKARAAGHGNEMAAEGALLDPDAAQVGAAPPQGDYRCRTIKVGAKSEGLLDYVVYPFFLCRIAAGVDPGTLSLVKVTGSQRPVGRLFPENERRMTFLGTLQLGDERGILRYGHDQERDMIGAFERIGPRRWRLILPHPRFESVIDVIEFVPAS
jgi:hypothetical protein